MQFYFLIVEFSDSSVTVAGDVYVPLISWPLQSLLSAMSLRKFLFSSVSNVLYELGSSSKVGGIARSLGCKSVVVVTDPGVHQLGLTSSVMESITREGLTLSVFDGVKEDPPESIVLQLIDFAKELKC